MVPRLIVIALLALILGACLSVSPSPNQQGAPSPVVIPSLPPTYTPIPTPVPASPTPVPPTFTPTPTETPIVRASGPDNFPPNVNPLTGLPVDPELLERRPAAVKIQIFPRGQRPPWGASFADIVYNFYQNNGMTRLNAIFYGKNAEQVGPIRSARLFDGNIVSIYKAIFAFGSADRRILNRLYNSDFADRLIVERGNNCPPMCRIEPNTFNFLVTNTEELTKYASENDIDNSRQDLNGMSFDPQVPESDQPGTQIFTRYSISAYSRWDYDPVKSNYKLFMDAAEDEGSGETYRPFVDRINDQQVTAENVVILLAPHQYVRRVGGEIIDIQLAIGGKAYAFRDGKKYDLQWVRATDGSVLFLTYADGKPYPYKPGVTWYFVIGQTSTAEQEAPGAWRFTFGFP